MELGLGPLAPSLLLGRLGPQPLALGVLAMAPGQRLPPALHLPLVALLSQARQGEEQRSRHDRHAHDDRDDGSGAHGLGVPFP